MRKVYTFRELTPEEIESVGGIDAPIVQRHMNRPDKNRYIERTKEELTFLKQVQEDMFRSFMRDRTIH